MKKAGICLAAVFFVISLLSPVFAAEKNSAGRLGFGVLSGGVPTVKYYLDKNLALEGGLTFASASSNNAAEVLVGLTNDFMAEEKIRWHWGGALVYITAPNTNSFTLQGIFGAEAFIFPQLSFNLDIIPFAYTSTNTGGQQSSTITILSATTTIFSSFHFYLN